MAKKRGKPNYAGGRKPRHGYSFAIFDAWLAANEATGIGKERWSELNAEKYKTTADALKHQLLRMQEKLSELG